MKERRTQPDPLPGRKSGAESIPERIDRPPDPRKPPREDTREEEAMPERGRGTGKPGQGGRR